MMNCIKQSQYNNPCIFSLLCFRLRKNKDYPNKCIITSAVKQSASWVGITIPSLNSLSMKQLHFGTDSNIILNNVLQLLIDIIWSQSFNNWFHTNSVSIPFKPHFRGLASWLSLCCASLMTWVRSLKPMEKSQMQCHIYNPSTPNKMGGSGRTTRKPEVR